MAGVTCKDPARVFVLGRRAAHCTRQDDWEKWNAAIAPKEQQLVTRQGASSLGFGFSGTDPHSLWLASLLKAGDMVSSLAAIKQTLISLFVCPEAYLRLI